MNNRQEKILQALLDQHLLTGQPVSSNLLAEKLGLDVSSATVRNELAQLTEEGYISQPHTSAGRLPTVAAYRWLIQRLNDQEIDEEQAEHWEQSLGQENQESETYFKQTAKALAEASGLAVFWAPGRHHLYYTGLSNLLQQPEFHQPSLLYHISSIIDQLDEIVDKIFDCLPAEPQILLGEDSPFGDFSAVVLGKYEQAGQTGLIGIFGPTRMAYEKNLPLIKYIIKQLNQ